MHSFSAIALAALATYATAAPWEPSAKHSTHRRHVGPNGIEFMTYHPPVTYETFDEGLHSLMSRSEEQGSPSASAEDAAIAYLSAKLDIPKDELEYKSGYSSETATHIYVNQKLNDVVVSNGVANVVFNPDGKIVAYGANVVQPAKVASVNPKLTEAQAIAFAETHLDATYNGYPIKTRYVFQDTDHAAFAYVVQVKNEKSWFNAYVDASNGKIVNVVDFVAHASYRVVPWSQQDPTWSGFSLVTDPADKLASPNGWHQDSKGTYNDTRGNNVIAYKTLKANTTTQSAEGLVFDYAWDGTTAPTTAINLDAARVNAFFIANSYHDLLYKYGFTEASFNFQNDNFGRGGNNGSDAIEMSVQARGSNNANFGTPPDGQPGHCNMYLWDLTKVKRDGDLSNDVITHEFTHGLTNRMTGGGTGECLSTLEAGGMGEGWSDALSFWTEQNSTTITDYALGAWVYNNPKGIRSVLYSTNMTVDPYTYASIKKKNEVHQIGEVWATVLVEVYAALVEAYGFSADIFNPDQTQGNIVFLHLIVDALSLQPCSPTFATARDAIILADKNRYGGANKCTLWKAFAKRGLGPKAKGYVDDLTLPEECTTPAPVPEPSTTQSTETPQSTVSSTASSATEPTISSTTVSSTASSTAEPTSEPTAEPIPEPDDQPW